MHTSVKTPKQKAQKPIHDMKILKTQQEELNKTIKSW